MHEIYELVYSSVSTKLQNQESIQELLKKSQTSNKAQDITGMLIYSEDTREFLQFIEGKKEAIKNLMEKIKKDPRHQSLDIFHEGPAELRRFSNWSMGGQFLQNNNLDISQKTYEQIISSNNSPKEESSKTRAYRFFEGACKTMKKSHDSGVSQLTLSPLRER